MPSRGCSLDEVFVLSKRYGNLSLCVVDQGTIAISQVFGDVALEGKQEVFAPVPVVSDSD